jgi:hypothetical protein
VARSTEDPEEHRARLLIEQISCPAFAGLQETGKVEHMGQAVASRAFQQAIAATVAAQREGRVPSDAELERRGGPHTDTMSRLMRFADLSALPAGQLGEAVEAGLVPMPTRLIVEARTERSFGPDKFGIAHVKPPPTLSELEPVFAAAARRASNTVGGISCALVLADCGELIVPVAAIAIAQEYWDPAHWPPAVRPQAERRLRERGDVQGPFVTTPAEVASAILRTLSSVETVARWGERLDGLPIIGGRLRLGFPLTGAGPGAGNRERYIGCCLTAIAELLSGGLIPFLALPSTAEATGLSCSYEKCDWHFEQAGELTDLRDLEECLLVEPSPWVPVPDRLARRFAGPSRRVFTLAITARAQNISERVTMVATLERSGRRELFVTTLNPLQEPELARIVELADYEIERRRPGSLSDMAILDLLKESHLQTNRRRRYPDRRSFAGLAQAAHALRSLARVA